MKSFKFEMVIQEVVEGTCGCKIATPVCRRGMNIDWTLEGETALAGPHGEDLKREVATTMVTEVLRSAPEMIVGMVAKLFFGKDDQPKGLKVELLKKAEPFMDDYTKERWGPLLNSE